MINRPDCGISGFVLHLCNSLRPKVLTRSEQIVRAHRSRIVLSLRQSSVRLSVRMTAITDANAELPAFTEASRYESDDSLDSDVLVAKLGAAISVNHITSL